MPYLIVFMLPVAFGINHLLTRYKYTRRSRRALQVSAVGSGLLSYGFIRLHWPELDILFVYAGSVVLALPTFVVLAIILVEIWRKAKQAEFDVSISSLRNRINQLEERRFLLRHQLQQLENQATRVQSGNPRDLAEQEELKDRLDRWQQGGGMARIRSIKVEEWQRQFTALGQQELMEERKRLVEDHSARGRDDQDRLQAQLLLVQLEILSRRLKEPNSMIHALDKKTDSISHELEQIEEQLPQYEQELDDWIGRRNYFLSRRIVLD